MKDAFIVLSTVRFVRVLVSLGLATSLAACSGGGSAPSASPAQSMQRVSGTLLIVTGNVAAGSAARVTNGSRKPAYVSAGTTHAALFINGSATPSGSTPAGGCTASSDGSGCTIGWTATLAVPSAASFAVEIDNGTTVLAEGTQSYALTSGTNTLTPLALDGVFATASFTVSSCPSTSTCDGLMTLADASGDAITYTGSTKVPATRAPPTTGTLFDNGGVTLVATIQNAGAVSGTGQSSGSNLYSTFNDASLSVFGVDTTGAYTYAVTCAAGQMGSFGLRFIIDGTPTGYVTSAELANVGVAYPSALTVSGAAPMFGCTNGAISTATGTLPVD